MNFIARVIILFFLILWSVGVNSQTENPLDFNIKIAAVTRDPNSIYFYPTLRGNIWDQPGKLSEEDCYYLYYGQIFQSSYKPIASINDPLRLMFDKATANKNCKKVLEFGETLLEKFPVDLTILLHVCNCIQEKGIIDTTNYFEQRFKKLVSAVLSTGDGKSMESSIKIVNMEDDYVIKGIMGFLGGKEKVVVIKNHCYSIWENKKEVLYFEDVMNDN